MLLGLQSDLLGHFFRLQLAERRLAIRTRKLRRIGGSTPSHQLELERQRLGRELHTGVGQLLAADSMATGNHRRPTAGTSRMMVEQALEPHFHSDSADALEHVRTISKRLHPPEWQRLTLEESVRQLWENSGIPQRFDSRLEIHPALREPDLEIKVLLYRAAQEAYF